MADDSAGLLRGSKSWAVLYAMSSLKHNKIRSVGIALLLAVGAALPTTVFVWTTTGSRVAVHDYFSNYAYQLRVSSGETPSERTVLTGMKETVESDPFVETVDVIPSSVGILTGEYLEDWLFYSIGAPNYAAGKKDCRFLILDNETISHWRPEFDYRGNFSLYPGQILVSEKFVDYTEDCHGVTLEVGDNVTMDLLLEADWRYYGFTYQSDIQVKKLVNYTIAGIYQIRNLLGHIGDSFISMTRANRDPEDLFDYVPVLGIDDSIIVLRDEFYENETSLVFKEGFFKPGFLIRGNQQNLVDAGVEMAADNMRAVKTRLSESYPGINFLGHQELKQLDTALSTFIRSQVISILGFPVLVMSVLLTVFTAETSIVRKKPEISTLRAKGASFNQIFGSVVAESIILSALGIVCGIFLALIMAPIMGASTGILSYDSQRYTLYLSFTTVPPLAIVIAVAIGTYLPISYLIHVSRRVDVSEIGQPASTTQEPEEIGEENIWRYVLALGGVLSLLLALPVLVEPVGMIAVLEILIMTLLLFIASYLGSRAMQLVTARLSVLTLGRLGEKGLYLVQSLRRRRGTFIPLMLILTLTLSTTSMMMIQSASFGQTAEREIAYAVGADLRVECSSKGLDYGNIIKVHFGVNHLTPVVETWGKHQNLGIMLEGIDPIQYLDVGKFSDQTFVGSNPFQVLSLLAHKPNGIVLSEHHASIWNITIGDEIPIGFGGAVLNPVREFEVVGLMYSAPGFGGAARATTPVNTISALMDMGVGFNGFALVNVDYLVTEGQLNGVKMFLGDMTNRTHIPIMKRALEADIGVHVYALDALELSDDAYAVGLYVAGVQGLTMIGYLMCALLGLASIGLFLSSAILERRIEYATFRALGATKRDIVELVFGEFAGLILAAFLISTILGVVFGYFLSNMTFLISPFSSLLGNLFTYPADVLALTLFLEMAVMVGTCYLPARDAGTTDPVKCLRNL
ncbi:ABC transporter permease [Candidatus Thorarchaeota archaeon]|nr:MAG: ABC transporter permease [Candidatus Thorarchaeota archaeon]